MKPRNPVFSFAMLVLSAQLMVSSALQAQSAPARTAYGKPNLTGTFDGATLTPLVRPRRYGDNLYLTPQEAEKIASAERAEMARRAVTSDPDREAPPEGGDGSVGAAGNVGGYNGFWIDRGTDVNLVDGKFRTSIIVDPKNGQMPAMLPAARRARAKLYAGYRRGNDGTAYWIDEGDEPGPYDNMEQRGNAERCLLGFAGAVPPLPSLYNNFKRVVQTEDTVMIMIEMVHDARVVRLNSEHVASDVRKWLGDSIGWWEGDTLVIDTTNFRSDSRQGRGGTENLHVVERLSRMDDGNLLYNFTVEDDTVWERPWTGEYVWKASDEKVYEYACHEGNYALGGIMRGARLLEREALEEKRAAKKGSSGE